MHTSVSKQQYVIDGPLIMLSSGALYLIAIVSVEGHTREAGSLLLLNFVHRFFVATNFYMMCKTEVHLIIFSVAICIAQKLEFIRQKTFARPFMELSLILMVCFKN